MQFRILDVVEVGDENANGGAYPDDSPHYIGQTAINGVDAQAPTFDEFVECGEGLAVQRNLPGVCGLKSVELLPKVFHDVRSGESLLTTSCLLLGPGCLNYEGGVRAQTRL